MRFLEDRRLYTDTDYCLEYCQSLPAHPQAGSGPAVLFHVYWYGELSALPVLSIKSFLTMHDPDQARLWLWLDAEKGYATHRDNPFIRPLLPLVTVRRFDPLQEVRGTFLDAELSRHLALRIRKKTLLRPAGNLVHQADVFRLLILHKYGGVYFDADMLFLRSLQPLLHHIPAREFCYQWSAQHYANTAILKMEREGDVSKTVMARALKIRNFQPWHLYQFSQDTTDLLCLPSPMFDSCWLSFDGQDQSRHIRFANFAGFFAPMEDVCPLEMFCPGAFTYHWHNQWAADDIANSHAGRFNREIDDILRSKYKIEPYPSFKKRD